MNNLYAVNTQLTKNECHSDHNSNLKKEEFSIVHDLHTFPCGS